jgi:hypothetical protein
MPSEPPSVEGDAVFHVEDGQNTRGLPAVASTGGESIPLENLELFLQLTRDSPEIQVSAAQNVDNKIFQTAGAACVLIGLAAAGDRHRTALVATLDAIAVLGFLVCSFVSIRAVWSEKFRHLVKPPELLNRYWSDDRQTILHAYVDDIARGWQPNEDLISAKHKAFRIALIGLAAEATMIACGLIASML